MFLTHTFPRLAFVLETPSLEPIEPLLDLLEEHGALAAVGSPLLAAVGPSIVHHVRNAGLTAVLDLRLFEGPRRMAMLVDVAAYTGALALTVQISSGRASLQAAVRAARGRLAIVGVLSPSWQDNSDTLMSRLQLAESVELAGVMGARHEIDAVNARAHFRHCWVCTDLSDDDIQRASCAPFVDAFAAGATTILVDSGIWNAPDPAIFLETLYKQFGPEAEDGWAKA